MNRMLDRDAALLPSKHESSAKLDVFLEEPHSGSRSRGRRNRDKPRGAEFGKWFLLGLGALVLLLGVAFIIVGVGDEMSDELLVWVSNSRR